MPVNGLKWSAIICFFGKGAVVVLGTLRAIPDVIIIGLGVIPLAYFSD